MIEATKSIAINEISKTVDLLHTVQRSPIFKYKIWLKKFIP
jgi:hypothetical protein